jgi:cytochrome P450
MARVDDGAPASDVTSEFDHNDPEFIRDPHAVYLRLHKSQPVVHSERYGGYWVLTRYRDVRNALLDWQTFSSGTPGVTSIPSSVRRDFPELPLEVDPPEHAKYRDIEAPWFSRASVAKLEADVRRIANELIDDFIGDGCADVVQQFAVPFVSRVLTVFLRLPEEDAGDLTAWVSAIFHGRLDDPEGADRASAALIGYIDDTITDRRHHPTDDYFTMLTQATIDGRPLNDLEIRGYGVVTMTAGQETTVNGIGTSLWHLAEHPADKRRLMIEPALIPTAIEEFLRFMSPIQLLGRSTVQAAHVGGTEIPAGETVAMCYGAANVDGEIFDRPEECIIDRRPNPHIAFGTGPHACIGAHLARLEMRVALEEVFRRMPDYCLDDTSAPQYTPHGDLRGFWTLPVLFGHERAR